MKARNKGILSHNICKSYMKLPNPNNHLSAGVTSRVDRYVIDSSRKEINRLAKCTTYLERFKHADFTKRVKSRLGKRFSRIIMLNKSTSILRGSFNKTIHIYQSLEDKVINHKLVLFEVIH